MIFGQVAHCRISFASYHFWPFLMTLLFLSSYSFCLPAVTLPMAGSLSLSLPDFCLKGKERLIVVYELYGCCLLTVPSYVSSLQQSTFCRSSFPVMKLWHIEAKCRKVFVDYGRQKEKFVPRLVVVNWSAWFFVTSNFNYFLFLYLSRFESLGMFFPAVIDWLLGVSTSFFFWSYFVFSFAR